NSPWWLRLLEALEHATFKTSLRQSRGEPVALFQTLRQPSDQRLAFIKVVSYILCGQCRRDLPFCNLFSLFLLKHRAELIRRVSLVEPIADDMKPLIGEEKYQMILNSGTSPAKMRALLDYLTTPKLKDKLYQSLVKHEQFVVEYLEGSG
uniref:CARD domain-containing protein n=1 Tax=Cyprinus carpio TaxID=7962 RepID=A0A8C1TS67_CYPCA